MRQFEKSVRYTNPLKKKPEKAQTLHCTKYFLMFPAILLRSDLDYDSCIQRIGILHVVQDKSLQTKLLHDFSILQLAFSLHVHPGRRVTGRQNKMSVLATAKLLTFVQIAQEHCLKTLSIKSNLQSITIESISNIFRSKTDLLLHYTKIFFLKACSN